MFYGATPPYGRLYCGGRVAWPSPAPFDVRSGPELLVVIPVYNEEAAVAAIVDEWMEELATSCEDFTVLAIDDGSVDSSLQILRRLQERFGPRLEVLSRPNRGHGQTCLEGYRYARSVGARFVLQIDSDGQCDPRYFGPLWRLRERHAVVYGVRTRRDDGLLRATISRTLRLMLRIVFRVDCPDANVPYRLMRTDAIQWAVDRIPADFNLSNVALAVLLASDRRCSHGFVPIGFRSRRGGEPSVRLWQFGRKWLTLHRDLRRLLRQPIGGAGTGRGWGRDDLGGAGRW